MKLKDLIWLAWYRVTLPIDKFRVLFAPGSIERDTTVQKHPNIRDALLEMKRQVDKWGIQNHESYTQAGVLAGNSVWFANQAKAVCDLKAERGDLSWTDILLEEVFEAIEEAEKGNLVNLDTELVQCIAVIQSWRESISRNAR